MSVHYNITANNEDFKRKMRENSRIIRDGANEAEKVSSGINRSVKAIGAATVATFSAQAIKGFVDEISRVRSEFQQLEIAFTTMLGSKEKADALMRQAINTAAKTPFDLNQVATGYKQLLAYGIGVEKLNDTLVRLGDVASGVGAPLNDIVYLYGTLNASGRVALMDIRQFAGRGIPIYEELAKVLGIAKEKVNDFASDGKISFEHVELAFKNMTSEGGRFANLMEKQSASIGGLKANLGDAVDMMKNELGQKLQPLFEKSLQAQVYMVENYEDIGKTILGLAVAYGSYKAVLITISAAEKLNMQIVRQAALERKLAAVGMKNLSKEAALYIARTKTLSIAKQGLGKSLKSLLTFLKPNPYVLAAAAVAGLTFAVYKLATADSAAEIATKSLARAQEERATATEEERSKTEDLMSSLKDETLTRRERQTILNELQKIYPSIFSNLDIESAKYIDIADKIKEVNELLEQKTRSQLVHEINTTQELLDRLKSGNIMSFRERGDANQILGLGWGESLTIEANEMIKALEKHLSGLKSQEDDILIASFNAVTNEEKRNRLIIQRNELQEKYNNKLNEEKSVWGAGEFAKSVELQMMEKSILRLNSEIEKYGDTVVNTTTKNKAYWEEEKKNAEEALGLLTSENTAKEWADARAKVAKAQAELAKYSVSGSGSQSGQTKKDSYIFDDQREEGIAKIQQDVKAFFDARRKANLEGIKAERQAEEEARVEYLIEWGNFEQKRIALINKYGIEASKAKTKAEKDGLLRSLNESLQNITYEELQNSDLWQKAFGDLDKISSSTIVKLKENLSKIDTKGWEPTNIKALQNAIDNLDEKYSKSNPLSAIASGWRDMVIAIKNGDKDGVANALKKIQNSIDAISGSFEKVFDLAKEFAGEDSALAASMGTAQSIYGSIIGIGSSAAKFATGDIMGGINDAIGSISRLFRIGKEARESERRAKAELEKWQDSIYIGELEYQRLIRGRIDLEQQSGETALEYQKRVTEELLKQQGQVKENYDDVMARLQREQYIAGKKEEKYGGYNGGFWTLWKTVGEKTRLVDDWEKLTGKSYDEIEKLFYQGKLSEEAAELFKQLRELKNEQKDIASNIGKVEKGEAQGAASYGAYEKITQDQADRIDGRLTGMHMIMIENSGTFRSMDKNLNETRGLSLLMLEELQGINKNTKLINQTNEILNKIDKNTRNL